MTKIRWEYIPVIVLLYMATCQDLRTGKISNRLILVGYGWGASYMVTGFGISGIGWFLIKVAWPVGLLYGLFLIRALGAGDIKLISAVSVFISSKILIAVILISFFIGAGIACARILKYLFENKILGIFTEGYERKIRFSVCISLGFFLAILGDLLET